MLSRIWLINVILGLFVVFFGLKAYGVWIHQGNKGYETPGMAQQPTQGITKPLRELYEIKIPPESEYDVLVALNLFSPERTEIIPEIKKQDERSKKLSVAEQKNITQYFTQLTLYGLVITNDTAEALVSYPVKKPALKKRRTSIRDKTKRKVNSLRVKQTKWIKAGDKLGDFTVVSIEHDRVFLKAGDQSYDLLLYDKEKIKKRRPAKPKMGPNVVGVSDAPKTATVKGKKETIPSGVKKGVTDKAPSSTIPAATQENLKKAIEKKRLR
jgi:hypothetical protein